MRTILRCAIVLCSFAVVHAQKTPILFQHVRVFDGTTVIPDTDVLIDHGKIKAIGSNLPADTAKVIDGAGKTLLPGLIDAHVHVHGAETLEQALIFGVTTEFDMMMSPFREHELKSEENDRRASFFSAGFPATVPGGHGTEYGMQVPTIVLASEAQRFVDTRLREGSDYIKIMYTAGVSYGRRNPIPSISKETMAAVISAAHERRRLAVVHIGNLEGARDAIDAGADGLAHLFHGGSCPKDFGQFVASHHAFVIPTLSVLHAVCGPHSDGRRLISDPYLSPYLSHENISRLKETFPSADSGMISCKGATQAIPLLQAAGVPILAGTDAPNPGTTYGASLHGELALYVDAGLTPIQALISATSAPAKVFHLPDRGRIAPGLRADLLLVNGHPDEDIRATRDIVAVYKEGNEVDRRSHHHGK
jgi:imidazolonepropionase-like amidohydrolase